MFSHPDADAFMRKYLEQPTDTTTRLVFADWLEESGQKHNAAWAYYIRLNIEADRYPQRSRERRELHRQAEEYVPKIRAQLTISAKLFTDYPKSFLQLLPAPNITVRLANFEIPLAVLELMPESVARENLVLPLDMQGRTLLVAAADPHDFDTAQKLEFILNREIVLVGAAREDMQEAIDRAFGQNEVESVNEYLYEFPEPVFTSPASQPSVELSTLPNSPVVRLVNLIIQEAINLRADRILIFPDPDSVAVRYRIDDEWVERDRMPARLLGPVSARLAILAMIPVEWTFRNPPSLTPMTGVFPLQVHNIHFHIRVTIQPSPDGPTTQIDIIQPDVPQSF
ncbi:MAG: TIGR02996 domain-containing protein [Planctomycetia bacterium]|nr:TIGR02996 domain-containing protein [Planctomycetia bacterium]